MGEDLFFMAIGAMSMGIGVIAVLVIPILAIVGFARASRVDDEVRTLRSMVGAIRRDMAALRVELGLPGESADAAGSPDAQPADRAAPIAGETGQPEPPPGSPPGPRTDAEPGADSGSPPETPESPEPDEPETELPAAARAAQSAGTRATASGAPNTLGGAPGAAPRLHGFEDRLASRWLVWLGAVAIALGGVFLVKLSIEQGWLGPVARVSLGCLFGLALTVAGEALRRHPMQRAIARVRPDYVPSALTAAGLFAMSASIYAAYVLYGMLPAFVTVVLLAGLSFAAIALSLLHGPFVALMGVAGGFVMPLLVRTGTPMAWGLFPYVAVVTATSLAIHRFRPWPWLIWAALAGAGLWPVLWFAEPWVLSDAPAVGIYLLVIAGLFLFIRDPRATWENGRLFLFLRDPEAALKDGGPYIEPYLAAAAVAAILCFALLQLDFYGLASLLTMLALCVLYLETARRVPALEPIAPLAAILGVVGVASWNLPAIIDGRPSVPGTGASPYGVDPGFILTQDLATFIGLAVLFSVLFGGFGFAALWKARRPIPWASLSAAPPVLLLGIAYWRVTAFEIDFAWGAAATLVAALGVAATTVLAQRRDDHEHFPDAMGIFAAAAVAALCLAATMMLREAWLTVALAVELPALAWIYRRLPVNSLRHVALAVACIVLARLVLNPYVLDYPDSGWGAFNWVLYGYGVPAAAFGFAAHVFRKGKDDVLIMVLEAGAVLFAVLLVGFEIRTLTAGGIDAPDYTLLEQSLQVLSWLAVAYGLQRRQRVDPRAVTRVAIYLLLGLAAGHIVLGALLNANPLWNWEPVGNWPVFNLLFLAYLAPAALALPIAAELKREGRLDLAKIAEGGALFLAFVFWTLQVTQLFHGTLLPSGTTTDAEWYAYSVAWLVFAAGLLGLGMLTGRIALRYASLGLILATVAKVFLFDMAELDGLWRVASFVGLGLVLVAIGFVYQRWVLIPGGGGGGIGEAEAEAGSEA